MEARVTKAFPGVPEGEIYPRRFEVDEIVTGRMAEIAVAEGWAVKVGATDDEAKAKEAPKRRTSGGGDA